MSQDNGGKKPKLNIELPEEVARAWPNLAVVTHSQTEFILDFIGDAGHPQGQEGSFVLNWQHAKRVMKMLVDNISKFEAQHGTIEMTGQPEPSFPMNFGGPISGPEPFRPARPSAFSSMDAPGSSRPPRGRSCRGCPPRRRCWAPWRRTAPCPLMG